MEKNNTLEFTKKRKVIMCLFALAFIVMVLGVIPWNKFGITIFDHTSF